jgi:putative ABC transport system permease protein
VRFTIVKSPEWSFGIASKSACTDGLGLIPDGSNRVLAFLGRPTLSPLIAAGTAAILGTIGLLAGYFPARRAAAIDPAATLRYE